jgi:hypothetical protein
MVHGTDRSPVWRAARIALLSLAALLAALGIPVIVRSSHRSGQRAELVQEADEPGDDSLAAPG